MIRNTQYLQKDFKFKILTFICCILIIIIRCPELFINPRLFAEEGPFYFSNAFHYSNTNQWYKGLTYISIGYFSLWPNIATTIAANFFTLEKAPLVTTLFAFVIQIAPIWIVLFGFSDFWETKIQKLLLVLIILFVPISVELWLTTITSQFTFGLIAFLILHSKIESKKWIYRTLLIIGGLTGILTCLLTPFFILRGYFNKSKERRIQAIILTICTLFQLFIVYNNTIQRPPISNLILHNIIWAPIAQSLGYLVLGYHGSSIFYTLYKFAITNHFFFLFSSLIIVTNLIVFAILIKYSKIKNLDKFTFLGSYFTILYISLIGALDDNYIQIGVGSRYFFIPNIILATFLLSSINYKLIKEKLLSQKLDLFFIFLMISIFWGMLKFPNKNWISNKNCPTWKAEVRKWRQDNNYELQNCPSDFQKIKLAK